MAKGLKTDGPEFSKTLCAVLCELDSMRDRSISEERGLINARKKLEKDLGKLGESDSPEADRVRVAYTKVIVALKACRAQIQHLNDQICRGLKFGQQPMLIQSEQEDRIRELVEGKEDAEHSLELFKATAAESARVGSQSGDGEEGPVGEPDAPAAAATGREAPDGKGGPMIANGTDVQVHDDAGELVAKGRFDGYWPADKEYSVAANGRVRYFSFKGHTISPVNEPAAPDAIPLDSVVRVLHIASGEARGEGTLEHETDELYRVRIGGKVKDFARDVYRIEAAPATPQRGANVRVTARATGETWGEGKLDKWHDEYAIVSIGGHNRRFAFDAYSVAAVDAAGIAGMVKGEIHESPAAEAPAKSTKPAKKSKPKKAAAK